MMKLVFFILCSTTLCFKSSGYWMVQVYMFIMSFYMLLMNFYPTYFVNISYFMGMDLMSYGLVVLSIWICSLMWIASEKIYKNKSHTTLFNLNIILLLMMLILSFSSMNLMMFYIFFESSLIPTLFLIFGWGYQPERLQAGLYLLFYTLFVSLPMFISIMYMYMYMNSTVFFLIYNFNFTSELMYISMIIAFLVKMPMFLVHLWLPSAHVEAPISGSMILAGVMLKLGGYGMLRVFPMMMIYCLNYNFIWITISLVGGVLISLLCLRQTDLKSLVAYSSVVHMGVALSGMMTMMTWGLNGAYCLMIGHGLCSSGLFCLVNMSYERIESRSLLLNKGMIVFMPSMTLWWFLLSSSNMAAPPSLNLLGEISLINSIMNWSNLSSFCLMLISFFSAAYMLYFYSYSQHGIPVSNCNFWNPGYLREYMLCMLHWIPLNLLILKSDMCFMWL